MRVKIQVKLDDNDIRRIICEWLMKHGGHKLSPADIVFRDASESYVDSLVAEFDIPNPKHQIPPGGPYR